MTKINLQLFATTDEWKKNSLKGVDSGVMERMNTPFTESAAYTDAMNYTNELLKKINSGKTSYSDQIKGLMDQIQNRPKFEYDVDSDPLFQQALSSAMSSGKTAMQDTIGQASALTGGYGSTYATTAGNQQYNAFIEDAYNNLPEYYQMALDAYKMEGDELYNQLGMLNTADATEYQRTYDAWGANFSNAQQIYQNDYQKWSDDVNNAFNLASMQNSDWWNQTNFAEQQAQHKAEMDYKYAAMAQDQAQFNSKYDLNGDGKVDYLDSQIEREMAGSNTTKQGNNALTDSEIKRIQEMYRGSGGGLLGHRAVEAYLTSIGKSVYNTDVDAILESAEAQEGLPVWYQTWTISNDTKNRKNFLGLGKIGDDNNDEYTNLNGQTTTFKELKYAIEHSPLSPEEKSMAIDALRKQSQK